MNTPKEYTLKTIEDMYLMVNKDNVDNFLKDFEGVVRGWVALKDIADKDFDIEVGEITWIDDNAHDIAFDITVKEEEPDNSQDTGY